MIPFGSAKGFPNILLFWGEKLDLRAFFKFGPLRGAGPFTVISRPFWRRFLAFGQGYVDPKI
jgi:hypothetical protein